MSDLEKQFRVLRPVEAEDVQARLLRLAEEFLRTALVVDDVVPEGPEKSGALADLVSGLRLADAGVRRNHEIRPGGEI